MEFLDISWPISNSMTEYKDRRSVSIVEVKTMIRDNVRESCIMLHSHTGTHIDAPSHFLLDGKSVEEQQLDAVIGKCRVVDLGLCKDSIGIEDIEKMNLQEGERILLKTANSFFYYNELFNYSFIYLTADAAAYCVYKKIKTIGIDYLGIERNQPDKKTHQVLLQAGITIIEGLRLAHINPGNYHLVCLPLLIPGCDAAPARAVLML